VIRLNYFEEEAKPFSSYPKASMHSTFDASIHGYKLTIELGIVKNIVFDIEKLLSAEPIIVHNFGSLGDVGYKIYQQCI
jgi:hypothetical protein